MVTVTVEGGKTDGAVKIETLRPVGNGGEEDIDNSRPYTVEFEVRGTAPLLFHRYDVEAVAEKGKALKGSKSKKSDNVESYVYRNEAGELCIPGEYFRGSIINTSRYFQDPRSPRKMAVDLFKAGFVVNDVLCSLGRPDWDYLDTRRAIVNRSAISRTRPAVKEGWRAVFTITVLTPEYINLDLLQEVLEKAGRLTGVGDFRPTYGRFAVHRVTMTDED